jgi:hypothetical protein
VRDGGVALHNITRVTQRRDTLDDGEGAIDDRRGPKIYAHKLVAAGSALKVFRQ